VATSLLMKKFLVPAVASFLLFQCISQAQNDVQNVGKKTFAEQILDGLNIGGSFRVQGESKEDYNFSDSSQSYWLTRFRIQSQWDLGEKLGFYIQAQDARVFGEDSGGTPAVNPDATPNGFEDYFDLRQAYMEVMFEKAELRLGRQEVDIGYDRLIGSQRWRNTSRTFDGAMVEFDLSPARNVQLFHMGITPISPHGFDDFSDIGNQYYDSTISGIVIDDSELLAGADLKYYWLFRNNDDFGDSVHTFGGLYSRKMGDYQADFGVAAQSGEFASLDQEAWMLHAGITKEIEGLGSLYLGYAYATGDEDPADGAHNTFDNLYPKNHKVYGQIDFFSLQNLHNLEIAFKGKLRKSLDYRVAYHAFWLDEPRTDNWYRTNQKPVRPITPAGDAYVGNELDLFVRYKISKSLWLDAGASQFYAGDYVEDSGDSASDPTFFYVSSNFLF